MNRDQNAYLLGQVIRLAKQGKTQAQIAQCIGVNPGKVYKLCKRYGIKTGHKRWGEIQAPVKRPKTVQCLLPL